MKVPAQGKFAALVAITAALTLSNSPGGAPQAKKTSPQASPQVVDNRDAERDDVRASRSYRRLPVPIPIKVATPALVKVPKVAPSSGSVSTNPALEAKIKRPSVIKTVVQPRPRTAPLTPTGALWNGVALPAILRRIRTCESGNGDGSFSYTNRNRHSTASGAFQFLDSTWHYVSKEVYGHVLWGAARDYSKAIQDRVALKLLHTEGTRPWYPSRYCWG